MLTLASAITPPDESVMVPRRVAVTACDQPATATDKNSTKVFIGFSFQTGFHFSQAPFSIYPIPPAPPGAKRLLDKVGQTVSSAFPVGKMILSRTRKGVAC